jgi:hypothetical protein
MAWLCLIIVIAFGVWSPGLSLVLRRLTRAFALYMGVAFIGRPLYLLLVHPAQGYGARLADPRLLTPTYWNGIQTVSRLALVGLIACGVTVYAIAYATRGRWRRVGLRSTVGLAPFWLIWMMCWLCRMAIRFGFVPINSSTGLVAGRFLPAATALLGVLVMTTDWRRTASGRRAVLIFALGELLWSFLDASKTPLLASLLFFYLDPERGRISVRLFVASAVSLLTAFTLVQGLKPGQAGQMYSGISVWQRGVISLLARLDALHAVAVAQAAGPGSYLSHSAVASRLLTGWIPQQLLGISRIGAGEMWAQLMNHSPPGVSLAQGPIAEGYAVAGFAGVVLWSIFSATALIASAWVITTQRRLVTTFFASYVIASAALFEQGAIGLVDIVGSAIQISLVCWILATLVETRDKRRRRAVEVTPQTT